MANDSNKEGYAEGSGSRKKIAKVVGLGLFSATSALAGGLAVAWWYRKTLIKLQNPIVSGGIKKQDSLEKEEVASSDDRKS